jgi:Pentapeptide repeats (8 copies)
MNRSLAVALISGALTVAGVLAIAAVAGAGLRIFHSVSQRLARHGRGPAPEPERTPCPRMAGEAAQRRLLAAGARLSAAWRHAARDVTRPRRTGEASEPGQVADRSARAAGQLGSGRLDVRLGGIYALERVAHDSPPHHPAAMDALAAFVREHSHAGRSPLARHRQPARHPGRTTPPDVQAAVTAIGRRRAGHDRQLVNLNHADLSGAHLTRANLAYASLAYADLTGADLTAADLTAADLSRATLTGARWPAGTPVPEGWKVGTGSGRLERAATDSGPTDAK